MPSSTTLVELLLIALAVALVTKRTRGPYTVALVIWGLVLGLLQVVEPLPLSKEIVLTVLLPPLLFDGALHVRAGTLRRRGALVFGLALPGTLLTALIVGGAGFLLLDVDLRTALLLGAIVAPTDPVSVLATLRANRVERELATTIEGESLFNDGVAVVLYLTLLDSLAGASLHPLRGPAEIVLAIGGGAAIGLVLGSLSSRWLARLDDHLVQVLFTIVVAYGAYVVAERAHLSGVVAVVVTGLVIGNGAVSRLAPASRAGVPLFWEIIAFLINSLLFLLIGFELRPNRIVGDFAAAAVVFAVLLGTRALIVYGLTALLQWRGASVPWRWRHLIVWAGLRGAVPVALALGVPAGLAGRDQLVGIVFGVVLFSLLGQGLTMPFLVRRLGLAGVAPEDTEPAEARHHETGRAIHTQQERTEPVSPPSGRPQAGDRRDR